MAVFSRDEPTPLMIRQALTPLKHLRVNTPGQCRKRSPYEHRERGRPARIAILSNAGGTPALRRRRRWRQQSAGLFALLGVLAGRVALDAQTRHRRLQLLPPGDELAV